MKKEPVYLEDGSVLGYAVRGTKEWFDLCKEAYEINRENNEARGH